MKVVITIEGDAWIAVIHDGDVIHVVGAGYLDPVSHDCVIGRGVFPDLPPETEVIVAAAKPSTWSGRLTLIQNGAVRNSFEPTPLVGCPRCQIDPLDCGGH